MIELVTLEEAKMHLRIDDDFGDSDLTLKIQGGSAAILSYIQGSRALVVDESGNLIDGETLTAFRQPCWFFLDILTVTVEAKRKRS